MLVDELHKQIYVKSVSGVVKGFQRQGSQRTSGKKDKTSLVKQVLTGTAGDDIQGVMHVYLDVMSVTLFDWYLGELRKKSPSYPQDCTISFKQLNDV